MMTVLVVIVLLIGINTIVWGIFGALRLLPSRAREARAVEPPRPEKVAVLIAARNEELVIGETIRSAMEQVPLSNVFVVSDASSDRTAEVARSTGAQVLTLERNRGKAGALVEALAHFDVMARFEVVVFLDADTQLAPDYLETGLVRFRDPEVVAVAGRASTLANPRPRTLIGRALIGYRERVYVAMQYLHKFGQASERVNAVYIVPGFASMYRTRILDRIDIAAPGLSIEDYNMTFEVHAKRLGRIDFHPQAAIAYTQDPDTWHDYVKQLHRWNLGFWQTVRRHTFKAERFWAVLTLVIVELLSSSLLVLLLLPAILTSAIALVIDRAGADPSGTAGVIAAVLPLHLLLIGALVPDYLLTIFAAIVARRPGFLVLGIWFPLLRVVDALVCVRSLADAFLRHSDGTWPSPGRRSVQILPAQPGNVQPAQVQPAQVQPVNAQAVRAGQRG